jgi:hypothetical protein
LDHGRHAIGAAPPSDAEFLELLARQNDVIDTTPAEAIKGEVARMPGLATVVIETTYPSITDFYIDFNADGPVTRP